MMQLGAEGVFVAQELSQVILLTSGSNYKAVTNYQNPQILAQISEDLEAMVGITRNEIQILMAERGK